MLYLICSTSGFFDVRNRNDTIIIMIMYVCINLAYLTMLCKICNSVIILNSSNLVCALHNKYKLWIANTISYNKFNVSRVIKY